MRSARVEPVDHPFSVPGKIALYLEDTAAGDDFGTQAGDTIGIQITDLATNRSAYYIPGCASVDDTLRKRLRKADIVILGGGFAGMSCAYNLAKRFPEKNIVLLEGACCGYGASGRNGGFADPGMPGLRFVYDSQGPEAARATGSPGRSQATRPGRTARPCRRSARCVPTSTSRPASCATPASTSSFWKCCATSTSALR